MHRYKARKHPEKYLTIILDGMDRSKTDTPNVRRVAKSTANLQKLCTHITGAIIHSGLCQMGKQYFGFFDIFQWKHDKQSDNEHHYSDTGIRQQSVRFTTNFKPAVR